MRPASLFAAAEPLGTAIPIAARIDRTTDDPDVHEGTDQPDWDKNR